MRRFIEEQEVKGAGCYLQSPSSLILPGVRQYPAARFANDEFDTNSTETTITQFVLDIRKVAVHRIIFLAPTTVTSTNLDFVRPAVGHPVAFRIVVDGTAGETTAGTTIELGGMQFPHGLGIDSANNNGLIWAIVYDIIN